jgi:hypothetical protein
MQHSALVLLFIVTAGGLGSEARAKDHLPNQGFTSNLRLVPIPRKVQVLSYQENEGSTRVEFRGTALAPKAEGHATIEILPGKIRIAASVRGLPPAEKIDPEKLTYVLWAMTPTGEASNLGEFVVTKGDATLATSTSLQSFAMMVTAEPYFAVKAPSEWVVLYNVLPGPQRQDTIRADLLSIRPNPNAPLDMFEARNAIRIARLAGAERYAAETFHKALQFLKEAETILANRANGDTVEIEENARKATEAAEDARSKAAQHQHEPITSR